MCLMEYPLRQNKLIAGVDEAGRGCLAGPVVAAATILPAGFQSPGLNDSKQVSSARRTFLRHQIESEALCYAVAFVFPVRIDAINILRASIEAMHMAIGNLSIPPEFLLIDGNRFYNYKDVLHECVVKGDGKYLSIAAASILAKTYRDEFMKEWHWKYPGYGWEKNKGYPTSEHRRGLVRYGPCDLHRKTFRLLPAEQIEIF